LFIIWRRACDDESVSEQAPSPPPRRNWRRLIPAPLRHSLTIFIALLVVEYLIVPKFAIAEASLHRLRHLNFAWLVAAIVLEAAALFTYALLTRRLLPSGGPNIGVIFRIDLATTAVSHVIPGGTVGSAGLGYRLMTQRGVLGRDTAFAMATQGLGSAVVLNLMLWISLVISIPLAGAHAVYLAVALVGMLAMLAVGALVYSFTRGEESAARFVRWIGRRLPRVDAERLEVSVRHIGDRLRDLWRNSDALSEAIGWAAANWLLDAACLWCFIAALGRYMDPILLFAAYGIGNVVAVIPLMPGGLGLVEVTTIGLLSASGLPPSVATLGVLGWRLVNFWLPIPVGAGCYISLRGSRSAGIVGSGRTLRTMTREARSSSPEAPTAEGSLSE
jgi:uncharacterized protein (TIRG00374 family)